MEILAAFGEDKDLEKVLKSVLDGISDIIGVYKPDHSLVLYNSAGYEFFKKKPEEVIGKKCYEILGRNIPCSLCTTAQAINTKKIVRLEKFIPEMGRCMECTSNPVFREDGELEYVVEQLRDVTEARLSEIQLQKSEEKFRSLVDLCPDAVVVIFGETIILANQAAVKLANVPLDELLGNSFIEFVDPSYKVIVKERMESILKYKKVHSSMEYKLRLRYGLSIDAEILSSYIDYEGKNCIQCVIRDITERKKEVEWAFRIQSKRLETKFPLPAEAELRTIYRPAQTLSGDFYYLIQVDAHRVVGIIGDVSGKGIGASMSTSAMKVLFYEAVYSSKTPMEIISRLNAEVPRYLEEEYVAACCFEFNFIENTCTVVSAGIGEYSFIDSEKRYTQRMNRGAFLGMMTDGMFEESVFSFKADERFYFYSDGFAEIFEKFIPKQLSPEGEYTTDLLDDITDYMITAMKNDDDCTLLEIHIKPIN